MKLEKKCKNCALYGAQAEKCKADKENTCTEWEPSMEYGLELARNLPEPEKTDFNDIRKDKDINWLIQFYENN